MILINIECTEYVIEELDIGPIKVYEDFYCKMR